AFAVPCGAAGAGGCFWVFLSLCPSGAPRAGAKWDCVGWTHRGERGAGGNLFPFGCVRRAGGGAWGAGRGTRGSGGWRGGRGGRGTPAIGACNITGRKRV